MKHLTPVLLVLSQFVLLGALYFHLKWQSCLRKQHREMLVSLEQLLKANTDLLAKLANPSYIIHKDSLTEEELKNLAESSGKIKQNTEFIYREEEDLAEAEAKNRKGRRYFA